MRRFLIVLAASLCLPGASLAQSEETLADIRQELSVLYVEIRKLNRELSTTGAAGELTGGESLLDRVNGIESELQRLISKTEELEFRITSVVKDGTNRIGDLEFRLCELEAGCDVSTLPESSTLGGVDVGGASQVSVGQTDEQPEVQMAVGEEADFKRAEEAMSAGNYAEAVSLLDTFRQTYPGGPLSDRAGVMKGDALEASGDLTGAARAYLDVFSSAPQGPEAASALYNLGRTLGQLGQTQEACVTLGEVGVRFPAAEEVLEANSEMRNLGCT